MFAHDDPLLAGSFGTHGTRFGNFTIQNSDLVLSIGARLSTRETGSPMDSWAREAKTINRRCRREGTREIHSFRQTTGYRH